MLVATGIAATELDRVLLAGGFGSYLRRESATRASTPNR
jgi:uncharacterized 2Fe-2S/4Fe-4S cluster protein (DUF4445 family)